MAKKPTKTNRTFHQELVLNQWLVSLFYKNLPEFSRLLDGLEGISETGQTRFFEKLCEGLFNPNKISITDLRRYDLNIIQHWQKITEHRHTENGKLEMKYFQYLSLLFTEIYLDYYFNRQTQLLAELNQFLLAGKRDLPEKFSNFQPYIAEDLNKLAFWNATGSGKTLLMHCNLLQYQHYLGKKVTVYLLTPNDGLSQQHLKEFSESGIDAALFDKQKGIGLFDQTVQILDIHKLGEKDGDKTIAVDHFEGGDKLVLVDEGHSGMSGDKWVAMRNRLIGDGFAFEYSATFGQSIKDRKTVGDLIKAAKKKQGELDEAEQLAFRLKSPFEVYAKSILFDYSYKYFYADGYGKESLILNLDGDYLEQGDNDKKYFLAGLLAFYQQLFVFGQNEALLKQAYLLEKPLWVFVGSKVNDDDSDLLLVLNYLAFFLNEPQKTQAWLAEILAGKAFLDKSGQAVFRNRFTALSEWQENIAGLYADILERVFNVSSPQRLSVVNLKKAEGEFGLKVGSGDYFGVINIGDSSKFAKTVNEQAAFDYANDEFAEGLFGQLNAENSRLQLLMGSKKFTEGWSSWRVSTMGLLNIGRNEGSQIIQLFGRGVRLKGQDFSLKRTQNDPLAARFNVKVLETLNIFGVRANYMQQFREYLNEEGVKTLDEMITLDFPVRKTLPSGVKLKTLRLKEGYKDNQKMGFKRQQAVALYEIPAKWQGKLKKIEVSLDLYPRLEALATDTKAIRTQGDLRNEGKLNAALFPFFDWDKIYLDLWQLKLSRTWFNLQLDKAKLRAFVENNRDWYRLYIPQNELAVNHFAAVEKQQKILQELLTLYTEQFYQRLKGAYEAEHYTAVEVSETDGSLLEKYTIAIMPEEKACEQKLIELADLIRQGDLGKALHWTPPFEQMKALLFQGHLYQPLFHLEKGENLPLSIAPTALNEGECDFVQDLMLAEKQGNLTAWLGNRSLYLLRNAANKSKGLGFALAGNFYPDFLLWIVDHQSGEQWLSFIDPKGIRNLDENDPKFGLDAEVKALGEKINVPNLHLSAFILSVTKQADLVHFSQKTAEEFTESHILFIHDKDYLPQLFAMILEGK